jgi:hypothetical protein
MKTSNEILDAFVQKYNTITQTNAMLVDPQNLIGELGRGSGKSIEILSPRMVRVSYGLPRATLSLAGPSYAFVIDTVVPAILTYLNKTYERGKHFEYGKEPPRWFKRPYTETTDWKKTISFPWGTVVQFVGIDRANTSGIGRNFAHSFIDEMLRISETNYVERLMPAQRGDRQIFGNSPYFGGVTGFSSTPNFENDHDWWLSWEQNMNKELIEEIRYVAFRLSQRLAEMEINRKKREIASTNNDYTQVVRYDEDINKAMAFAAKWEPRLNDRRKGTTYYMKGTSFTNLIILGLDYMKNQMQGSRGNFDKFKLSILGIRPTKVKDLFFAQFGIKNIFDDSYKYNHIDLYEVDGTYKKSSRDLKHCDDNLPLLMGLDPGNFMSAVFAQERNEKGTPTLRVFKNLYTITPESHFEMASKINNFFAHHHRKVIYLHYDRAGNQRKADYAKNKKGNTDAQIIKTELETLGWTIHLMSQDQKTIFHWQHYLLLARLMAERETRVPNIRICQNECEELISSIYMSPLKKTTDGTYELDKSSETRLDYADQAFYSTQIPSALMYLVFGKYSKWLPAKTNLPQDIEGL